MLEASRRCSSLVCMYGHTHTARVWINRVRLPILLVVSSAGKMNISRSTFSPENLVSRDGFGNPVPRQPAHLHTQAKSGAYLRNSSRVPRRRPFVFLNRHTPSGQSRVYWVTQLRIDDIHCRESAGTGPVVIKVVPNECCLGKVTMDQLICASLSHTHYWCEVGMLKVPAYVPLGLCCDMYLIIQLFFDWLLCLPRILARFGIFFVC